MELKNQVTSLEISKKLKELGVKQKSVFYLNHLVINIGYLREEVDLEDEPKDYDDGGWKCVSYSAFTVAELGEMLTEPAQIYKISENEWVYRIFAKDFTHNFHFKNEADGRANSIIYLIENNYLDDDWKKKWLNKGLK